MFELGTEIDTLDIHLPYPSTETEKRFDRYGWINNLSTIRKIYRADRVILHFTDGYKQVVKDRFERCGSLYV